MKAIPLTRGMVTLVDDEDFDYLSQWKWYAQGQKYFYAVRQERVGKGKQRSIKMHRVIAKATPDELVDHRSRNTLDNQKSNLRKCGKPHNGANAAVRKDNTSGFKGVTFHKRLGRWHAQISGANRSLGYFDSPIDAAKRYDQEAISRYGEFALTNRTLGLIP